MEIRKVEKDTTPLIQLERMPQQLGVSISEEDWSGITSPTQRRALQNRINQRAYRRRLTKRKKGLQSPSKSKEFNIIRTGNLLGNPQSSSIQGHHSKADAKADSEVDPSGCAVVVCQSDPPTPEDTTLCKLTWVRDSKIIQRFEDWAARNHKLATSNTDHLLVLVKFNIWRAFISNTFVLGLKLEDTSDDDAISPFNTMAPGRLNVNLPPSLHPTRLQRAVIHHPWIDMIPISGMRDNLIRAGDSYDDMALCGDLVGFFSPSTCRTGMVIWREAWDPWAWEATEPFLEYWGWTLRGCREVYESTNYWRAKRGESRLHWSIFNSTTSKCNIGHIR